MNQSSMKPEQVISTLNCLIEVNRDGQKGFQESAEKIEAPELTTFCLEQSRSRAHFVGELQTLVHSLGAEPDDTGTVTGSLQRGWMDLKSALGGGDHAILEVTESSEDRTVQAYRDAIAKNLPGDVRDIVERQYQSVKQAHDKVKSLRFCMEK